MRLSVWEDGREVVVSVKTKQITVTRTWSDPIDTKLAISYTLAYFREAKESWEKR